ncbi:MAG: type II toxin-antitoxin system RelE/ParE family toxin [Cyanobacteria bacterium P01_D01_bin.1]
MYSIRLTEQADADLLSIYTYSYNTWGDQQAAKYTDGLREAIKRIADQPNRIGTVDRSSVRLGYRSYHQKRHLIFYRTVDNYVEIVRILHDSMDIDQQFSEE